MAMFKAHGSPSHPRSPGDGGQQRPAATGYGPGGGVGAAGRRDGPSPGGGASARGGAGPGGARGGFGETPYKYYQLGQQSLPPGNWLDDIPHINQV